VAAVLFPSGAVNKTLRQKMSSSRLYPRFRSLLQVVSLRKHSLCQVSLVRGT